MPIRPYVSTMFGLREKLSLSFAALLIIVLTLGIQSVRHLGMLQAGVADITEGTFDMALAAGDIQEGLVRIDSGVWNTMRGSALSGHELIEAGRNLVDGGLSICKAKATRSDDLKRVARLEDAYRAYMTEVDQLRAREVTPEAFEEEYGERLKGRYSDLFEMANGIEESSENRVMGLYLQVRQSVQDAKLQTMMVLVIAFFIALAAIYATGRYILIPILHLTHSAEEVRRGNLDVELPPVTRDELGRLTMAFNQMAASLKALRTTEKARLLKLNRATESIFSSLHDAIALVTPEGEVEVATPVATEAFGLVSGGRVTDVTLPWLRELFDRSLDTDEPVHLEAPGDIVQFFIEGDEHFFYPEAIPILDDDGDVRGVVIMLHDITQMREQAELKRDVVSTVSHQLKTPLTSIRMAHHLLLESRVGDLTDKQQELITMARDESDRLFRMVEGLLDINRIKSGRVNLEFGPMPAETALSMAVDPFRSQAEQAGIELQTYLADHLPDLWVDATRIEHVFSNLVSNALKYTEAGGRIALRAEAEEQHVRVEVSDTGVGIPEAYRDKVFNQFFRVPNQDGVNGAGLGLAIVQQIVEAHGGSISLHSIENEGTTFTVRVPRADCAEALGLTDEVPATG